GARAGAAVVYLVDPAGADGQGTGREVGRGAGRVVDAVVAGVAATDRDAADADRLAAAHVLGVEHGRAVAGTEVIARHAVVAQGDAGAGAAVIDLVDPAGADGQGAGREVGRGAGRVVDAVVAGVAATDRDAADADCLAAAHGLVRERRCRVAGAEDIAADPVVAQGDAGAGAAVVDLVDPAG